MAAKDFDPDLVERLIENVEKLNDILGNSTLLMSEEEKARRDEIKKKKEYLEKEQKLIKEVMDAQEEEIKKLEKSTDAKDKEIAASYRAQQRQEAQRKSEESLNNRRLVQYQKELKELERRENQISIMTRSQREEIAKKSASISKAQKIEDIKDKIAEMSANKGDAAIKAMMAAGKFINNTFLNSTKGQGKYGEAMDSLGDKVIGISMLFGPWGKAIGLATGGLMKLAAMGLKHNEEMNKAYENLSEFGQVDAKGIPQLFENLQNAGFVMKEMDKFQGVMKDASKDLAYLGNSAADGQKAMTQLYGKTLNTTAEKTLKNLGYTNEQALKTYINYSGQLSRLGLSQGKSQEQVAKESLEYATTLDELTKLTGVQRDELQERQRRAEADVKYRIALARATPEMQKQIKAFAMSAAGGGEEFASGIRELIANGGNAVSEAGVKVSLATNGAANKIIRQFNRGEIDYAEANRRLAQSMDKSEKSMRNASVISGETANAFLHTGETMDYTNLWLNKSSDAEKQIRENMAAQASGALDDQRRAETQRQISERNSEQAKDKLAQIVGKGISPTMERLEIVAEALGKTFAKILKMLPFGPDLTEAFQSRDEKLKDKEKKLKELEIDIAKSKKRGAHAKEVKLEEQYEQIKREIADLKGEGGEGGTATLGPTSSMGSYLRKVAQVESGGKGNAKAGTSTAAGLFQFTEGTWNQTVREMGKNYSSRDRFDPRKAAEVAQYFTQKQSGQLEKVLGRKPSDGELYMAHFLGAGGAIKFLQAMQKNPNGPASEGADPSQVSANKTIFYEDGGKGRMRTLAEVYGMMSKKLDKAGETISAGRGGKDLASIQMGRTGGMFSGPTSGYPVMLHGNEVVIPMDDPKSTMRAVQKTALEKVSSSDNESSMGVSDRLVTEFQSFSNQLKTIMQPASATQQIDSKLIADTISSKLDSVIEHLRRAANTQEELLQHSRN